LNRAANNAEETGQAPDYLQHSLGGFLEAMSSGEPVPGGGGAAAVSVALAAGLCAMCARFSGEHLSDSGDTAAEADGLRRRVQPLAQEDAGAYGRVLDALRLPKEDPARRRSMELAFERASEVPLSIAQTGAETAELAAKLARCGNPNLKGDAVSAALLAEAGVRAAAMLVGINAPEDEPRIARASELKSRASASALEATRDTLAYNVAEVS
jgi:formiminotetrahydrofolate cyclodeaminase